MKFERAERNAASDLADKDLEIKALQKRLDISHGQLSELDAKLAEKEEAERIAKGKTKEQLTRELKSLKSRNEKLQKALNEHPDDDERQSIEALVKENDSLKDERGELVRERQELQNR